MNQQRVNPMSKSDEKVHYERITKYLLWALGISGTLITGIAVCALTFTFNDRTAMRNEYAGALKDFRTQISDLKNEENETLKSIKEDANQTVAITKADSKDAIATAKTDLRDQIKLTNESTQNELIRIRAETYKLALTETQDQIEKIFKSNKIQDIIENQAVKEIKEKVTVLVNTSTRNLTRINDAASKMRIGLPSGAKDLKKYFTNSTNASDSGLAKELYDLITNDYNTAFLRVRKDYINYKAGEWSNLSPDYSGFKIIQNTYPANQKDRDFLKLLIKIINNENDEFSLNDVASSIFIISAISNKAFKPFEINEINSWYKGLIGKPN